MFDYHRDNADYFNKIVENTKKGYYFRKWFNVLQYEKQQEQNQSQSQKVQLTQVPQVEGDTLDQNQLQNQDEQEFNRQETEQQQINIPNIIVQQDAQNLLKIQQDLQDQLSELRKKTKEDEFLDEDIKHQEAMKRPINLKFGDIIFFKYYVQSRYKGIISGDGIASNKIELIPEQKIYEDENNDETRTKTNMQKNASLMFRKCLFQIVNGMKYSYYNQLQRLKELEDSSGTSQEDILLLERKCKQEQEENERINQRQIKLQDQVVYGQEIQLKHIYSNCTVTINQHVLARANCCREMSLEEQSNDFSNFFVLSLNNSKKLGEPVLYSDQVVIVSSKDSNFNFHISETTLEQFQNGLEVNCFEQSVPLKICNYMDCKEFIERQSAEFKASFLEPFDIVILKNRAMKGKLGVKQKIDLSECLKKRKLFFECENSAPILNFQQYFDIKQFKIKLKDLYQIYLDTEDDENSTFVAQCLWEIQPVNCLFSSLPKYTDKFKIKNITSGLYLQIKDRKLQLTYDGTQPSCQFELKTKKGMAQFVDNLKFNEMVKIQSVLTKKNPIQQVLYCLDEDQKSEKKLEIEHLEKHQQVTQSDKLFDEVISVDKDALDKSRRNKSYFDVLPPPNPEIKMIADRLSSLFPYLLNFYFFLQDWGVDTSQSIYIYKQKKAFDNQKELFDNIQQLYQSLDNLELYLQEAESYLKFRQQTLLDNGIINLIICILKLIHFMIYGNKEEIQEQETINNAKDKDKSKNEWMKLQANANVEIPERSAQKIAQVKLVPAVKKLYAILLLCINGNNNCAQYVLSSEYGFLDFFLSQLKYYKPTVMVLLREAVRYLDTLENSEENVMKWVKKLETVTEQNLPDQTFFLELLTLTITDSVERAIPFNQGICMKKLFKSENSPFNKTLLSFEIKQVKNSSLKRDNQFTQEMGGDFRPIVIFNIDKDADPSDFIMNNMNFTELYQKSHKLRNVVNPSEYYMDYFSFKKKTQPNYVELAFVNGFVEQEITKHEATVLNLYEDYIITVLTIYANLCQGRNLKMIEILEKQVKLSKDYIALCLKFLDPNHLRLHRCLLMLYYNVILDVEPMLKISEYDNKCFLIEDIIEFEVDDKSYHMFKEICFSSTQKTRDAQKKLEDYGDHLNIQQTKTQLNSHEILRHYADLMYLIEERQYQVSGEIQKDFLRSGQNNFPDRFSISFFQQHNHSSKGTDFKMLAIYQIEYFLQFLLIIKSRIDLGYNDLETNKQIYKKLPNLFIALIDSLTEQQQLQGIGQEQTITSQSGDPDQKKNQQKQNIFEDYDKNWLYKFMIYVLKILRESPECFLIITKVYVCAIQILNVLKKLKMNLQLVISLQSQIKNRQQLKQRLAGGGVSAAEKSNADSSDILNEDAIPNINKQKDAEGDQLIQPQQKTEENKYLLKDAQTSKKQVTEDVLGKIKSGKLASVATNNNNKGGLPPYPSQQSQLQGQQKATLIGSRDNLDDDFSKQQKLKAKKQLSIELSEKITDKKSRSLTPRTLQMNKNDLFDEESQYYDNNESQSPDSPKNKNQKQFEMSMQTIIYNALLVLKERSTLKQELMDSLTSMFLYIPEMEIAMNNVEIIDDEYELSLYKKVNGNDPTQQITPKFFDFLSQKAVKFILSKQNNNKQKNAVHYDLLKATLQQYNDLFELSDYDTFQPQPEQTKEEYIVQLQNLFRNAGIHTSLSRLIQLQSIYNDGFFLHFYYLLVKFFQNFCMNNRPNIVQMLPQIQYLLKLVLIPYQQDDPLKALIQENEEIEQNQNMVFSFAKTNQQQLVNDSKLDEWRPQPLKISKLCIAILDLIKDNFVQIQPFIDLLFGLIEQNNPFSTVKMKNNHILHYLCIDIRKAQAIIQWLKILKSLTSIANNCVLPLNQQKILNSILKINVLVDIVSPMSSQYLNNLSYKFQRSEQEFWKLKLHVEGIQVLTNSFKNNRLGIQEVQRFIMFDTLKSALCHISAPYMLKRAYMRCLFEAYINRVYDPITQEVNEVISAEEISEILSREIIPQMDTKNIYMYLEGLVHVPKYNFKLAEQRWEIRKQIIHEKIGYFEKNKEYKALCNEDELLLKRKDNKLAYRFKRYPGIIADPVEFWKYIMNEGMMHFLTDAYDERIDEIENEHAKESTLADEYSIIKTNMMKLRQLFDILERDFRVRKEVLHLEEYRDLINQIEEIIPKRKIIKFGKNFRIGIEENTAKVHVETYDTVAEDLVGQGFQDVDDGSAGGNGRMPGEMRVKKFLRIFVMRNRIDVTGIEDLLRNQLRLQTKTAAKALSNVLNKDKTYLNPSDILAFLNKECGFTPYKQNNQNQTASSNNSASIVVNLFSSGGQGQIIVNQLQDFSEGQFEQIIGVIRKIFKKHRGPKEIIEDEKGDEDPPVKIKPKRKKYIENLQDSKDLFTEMLTKQIDDQMNFLKKKLMDSEQAKQQQELAQLEGNTNNERVKVDIQLTKLIKDLVHEYHILRQNKFFNFIERAKAVFIDDKFYLIKMIRILMQIKKPLEEDIQNRLDDNIKVAKAAKKRLEEYQVMQKEATQAEMHAFALKSIKINLPYEIIYESVVLLIEILSLGNQDCQNQILQMLKTDKELQLDIFTYFRIFFQTNINEEIKKMQDAAFKNKSENKSGQTPFKIMALRLLELLRLLCENVNNEMQNFLRIQNDDKKSFSANTDMIHEVTNFLSSFLEDNTLKIAQKADIILQCIDSLIDMCTGEPQNQKIICENKRLFTFINDKIIEQKHDFKQPSINILNTDESDQIELDLKLFSSTIKFLLIVISGFSPQIKQDRQALQNVVHQINHQQLMFNLKKMYEQRIKGKKNNIIHEINCNHVELKLGFKCNDRFCEQNLCTQEDELIVRTGFNIFIFFSYLADIFCTQHESAHGPHIPYMNIFQMINEDEDIIEIDENKIQQEEDINNNNKKQQTSLIGGLFGTNKKKKRKTTGKIPISINQEKLDELKEYQLFANKANQGFMQQFIQRQQVDDLTPEEEKEYDEIEKYSNFKKPRDKLFLKFFKKFRGMIEIVNTKTQKKIQRTYFQKPFISNFTTDYIKEHLIFQANRDSDIERIDFLIHNYEFYFNQMNHKQNISKNKIFAFFANNWRFFKDISFYLVLVITGLTIATYDDNNTSSLEWLAQLEYVVTIIQLIISIIVLLFCAYERYPISINLLHQDVSLDKITDYKSEAGFQQIFGISSILSKILNFLVEVLQPEKVRKSYWKTMVLICLDTENIYNGIYIVITFLAFNNQLVYCILLLDIVKRSADLQNIISSITLNVKNIAKFIFLGLAAFYIYSIWNWENYREYFSEDDGYYASSFVVTISQTIKDGLGIVDPNLKPKYRPNSDNSVFWNRFFFDIAFYIIFQMLFLQIIFGIILDTFGELRQQRDELVKLIEEKCFGKDRSEIDNSIQTKGWYNHIYLEHNVYHLLYYIIYVARKHQTEQDALEKQVYNCIMQKETDFVPIQRSLLMETEIDANENRM